MAVIEISDVCFGYPRQGHRVQNVSLAIQAGELCCLLGPNGAGKTTLLRCLLSLLTPTSGSIRVAGSDIARLSPRQLARLVAYVPQAASTPFAFSTLDIAVMGRTPHLGPYATPSKADRRAAALQLQALGIAHLADRPFAKLSGGERQLALLARALVQEAPVLVLDEPTAALDYGNEVCLLRIVRGLASAGRSILMTTHQPAHALGYANRAVLLREGKVVGDGRPEEIVTGESLSLLYGVPIHVAAVRLAGTPPHDVLTCVAVP
jgi:iron complex transport system ATP-binding protein